MGNWNMTVQGVGAHHNQDHPGDANKLFAKFVKELRDAGHQVQFACMTNGGAESALFSGTEITDVENNAPEVRLFGTAPLTGSSTSAHKLEEASTASG